MEPLTYIVGCVLQQVDEVPVETHELGHMIDIVRDIRMSKHQILKATNQATIFGSPE